MSKQDDPVAPNAGRSKEEPSASRSICDQGTCGDEQPLRAPRLPGLLGHGLGSAGTTLISCC